MSTLIDEADVGQTDTGPDRWHSTGLVELVTVLQADASRGPRLYPWMCDRDLKYLTLQIQIDTRDAHFRLLDRNGAAIDPQRVHDAIARAQALRSEP